ncbi:hypothetical protein [Anaeromyxobacter oryzisoli]|uniref:hypothetical protein n=1 Tax=Anaeromyxobacter oryzisoli TaxID=2925408 RepID=UPI001F5A12A6|nr:hypothetical protein [Anaeromyxobacter sp. SG63]
MLRRFPRFVLVAVLCIALSLGVGIHAAYADLFGADLPILTEILSTALKQLDTASKTFETLGNAYRETKKIATYAADAKAAFDEIQSFSGSRLANSGLQAIYRAYPEVSFLQGEAQYGYRSWGQSYGGLSPELQRCLQDITRDTVRAAGSGTNAGVAPVAGSGSACDQWQRTVTAQKLDQDLRRTFGDLPQGRPELALVRADDIAREQRYQAELLKKASVEKQVYDSKDGMLQKCLTAHDPVVCQTLAAQAQIQTFEQQAETNRKLEELIHQQTVANELRIADARRVEDEERARRASLIDGLRAFGWKGTSGQTSSNPSSPAAATTGSAQ